MVPFHSEITIRRPVDQVFEFVSNPQNYSKWMNGVTGVNSANGSLHTGSMVKMEGRFGMWNLDEPMQITAYQPPRVFGMKGTVGPLLFDGRWDFEPTNDSETRLTVSGEFGMSGMWRLAEPLFAGEVRNGEAKELQVIKQQLEG